MGKTYRHAKQFDDERSNKNRSKPGHANGKKTGGMRIINDPFLDQDDDYFDDDVSITDEIVINKYSDDNS